MAEEYRQTQYWGAGDEGRWYVESIEAQREADLRFRSGMDFVRYCVRYTLEHDKSLKGKKISSPAA